MSSLDRITHTLISFGLLLGGLCIALLGAADYATFGWLLAGVGVLGVVVRLLLPPIVRGGGR